MNSKQTLQRTAINITAVFALFIILFVLQQTKVLNAYYTDIMVSICINIILTVSLNFTTGFLGQLVLGHAAFMSIGAYTAALISKAIVASGAPLALAIAVGLILAGIMAAVFGFIIGMPALRLRGDYLAIITLGFGEIIRVIIQNLPFTGGASGLYSIPTIPTMPKFTLVYFLAAISIFIMITSVRSRAGRAVISIREDEIASEASGIPTTRYKMLAFVLAAFFAGIAGGLYAHNIAMIQPSNFNFNLSVELVIMVVLGGMGSLTGSVIAAIVLTALPEVLRNILGSLVDYRMVIYSLILILFMIFRPGGFFGQYEFSLYDFLKKHGLLGKKAKDGK